MRNELQEKAQEYRRAGSRRRKAAVSLALLSLLVVLGTFFILASPAETLEEDPAASTEVVQDGEVTGETTEPATTPSGDMDAAATDPEPCLPEMSLVLTYQADGLLVTATLDNPAAVPNGTTLWVTCITQEDGQADTYRRLLSSAGIPETSDFAAYELRFVCDGQEVTPEGETVAVAIAHSSLAAASDTVRVFRSAEEDGTTLQEITNAAPAADGQAVEFAAAYGGVYLVACEVTNDTDADSETSQEPEASAGPEVSAEPETSAELETSTEPDSSAEPETSTEPNSSAVPQRTEYIYNGDGLHVTAALSNPSAIPDEAELSVTRITGDSDAERYAAYQELLRESTGSVLDAEFTAYEIAFLLDGQELEPSCGTVAVTIEDTVSSLEAASDVAVFHVAEEDTASPQLEEVAAEATAEDGSQEVAFTADSFSTYIVLPVGSSLTYKQIVTEADTFVNTSYYNANRLLGIAGNFHIVAFDTATLNVHTNGNILADTLYANANFGTNNLSGELSYIQNYLHVSGNSASSSGNLLVVGSDTVVTLTDNNNAFAINGTKLDSPKNLWQDADTDTLPFIDMNYVRSQIGAISTAMASMSTANVNSSNLSTSGGSCDSSYLQLTNADGVGVYNISASTFCSYRYFGVKGFQSGHSGTVIINIDCSGAAGPLNLPTVEVYIGTTKLNFQEVSEFNNGKVILNFLNCSATINTSLTYASIIAPDAVINLRQLNGTVIGRDVTVTEESHRDDFVGKLTDDVTVSKVWLAGDNTRIPDGDLTGFQVTVQLYKTPSGGGSKTAYGSPVTLSSTAGWTHTWTGLPDGYYYTVEETAITKNGQDMRGSFAASYSTTTGVTSGVLLVYNKYKCTLPETGGMGSAPYAAAGLMLMSAALLKLRRRGVTVRRRKAAE